MSRANPKTGPVPVQTVGKDDAETRASCYGCALAPPSWGGPTALGGCYYWLGNGPRASRSMRNGAAPKDLASVLERTPRGARVARFGAGGDPARVALETTLEELELIEAAGMIPVGYTHHGAELAERLEPEQLERLQGAWLASCETLEQAAELEELGWGVALAGPSSPPPFYVQCPQERAPWLTCSACALCNPGELAKRGKRGVVFAAHGNGRRRLPLAGAELS